MRIEPTDTEPRWTYLNRYGAMLQVKYKVSGLIQEIKAIATQVEVKETLTATFKIYP